MSTKNTIILVGVLAALCAGYWLMLRTEKSNVQDTLESKRLFSFAPDEVTSMTVAREGEPPVVGERTAQGWVVKAPTQTAANEEQWQKMAQAFASLSGERQVGEAKGDLAPYELDKPRLVVTARAKGKEVSVAFGKITPTQDYRYARLGDGPVILAADGTYKELNRPLLELRHRSMVRVGKAGITRFEFTRPAPPKDMPPGSWEPVKIAAEVRPDGRWYMLSPVEGAADQEMVGNLVASLQVMPGRDYVDNPASLADYQLDPPRAQITAWTGEGSEPQTVLFGTVTRPEGQEPGVFVKRADSPSVFVVPAGLLTVFPERPDSFRDMRLLTHAASAIRRMQYRTPQTDVILEAGPKAWKLVQPPAEEVDQEAISMFIQLMKMQKASAFTSDLTPDQILASATVRWDLTMKDGKTVTLAVGGPAPGENRVYGLQDTGSVVVMDATQVAGITVPAYFFRSKDIYKFPQDKAARMMLHFEGVDYDFVRNDAGEWEVQAPAGKRWELQSDMLALLKGLSQVQAMGVEPPEPPADPTTLGLDSPVLSVEVVMPSTTRGVDDTHAGPLKVGQPTADNPHQRYATVAGRPEIYRVSQGLVDAVRESLRGIRDR